MRLPARTIWDARIQVVCGAVSALDREHDDVELWMCGNFGQASLDPPRVIINPNRLYPIDGVIRREGRFALSVFPRRCGWPACAAARRRRRARPACRFTSMRNTEFRGSAARCAPCSAKSSRFSTREITRW